MARPRKNARQDDYEDDDRGRASRHADDRHQDERDEDADAPTSPLHIPRNRWPDGMTLRWIRIEANNAIDSKNWATMNRIGWQAVPRELYADLFPISPIPGMQDTSGGSIIFGGLVLCQRPTRQVLKDRARQEAATRAANETVQPFVEGGNTRFQQSRIISEVTSSRGTPQFKE